MRELAGQDAEILPRMVLDWAASSQTAGMPMRHAKGASALRCKLAT